MNKEYYKNLEDTFRKLYYSHKHDEAKALYEENVEKGLIPRLQYNKEVLELGNRPNICVLIGTEKNIQTLINLIVFI